MLWLRGGRNERSSEAPWPETRRQRDQQARIAVRLEGGAVEGQREDQVEAHPVAPGRAHAAADRSQLLVGCREQAVLVPNPGLVDKDEGLEGEGVGGPRIGAAVAKLRLDAEAAVAEDGPGIVAAADRVVAGRKLLEAEQRLAAILAARPHRDREQRVGPVFAIRGAAHDRGRGGAL